MGRKRKSRSKKVIAAVAATVAAIAAGGYFWISSSGKITPIESYSVERVVDGDTFVTKEKQIIRLATSEAPEIDECGGPEAKAALEKLISGKKVSLKSVYNDKYHRYISLVYADGIMVNKELLRYGYAYYASKFPGAGNELQNAVEEARQKKRGLHGPPCTQRVNPKNPSCNIKGNITVNKFYYTPDCGMYDQVDVQLYLGDRWFCTEKEAQKSGFNRPSQCP